MSGLHFALRIITLNKIIRCMLTKHAFSIAPSKGEFLHYFFFFAKQKFQSFRSNHAHFQVIATVVFILLKFEIETCVK